MHQILVTDLVDIALGPESQFGGGTFGPLVDQRADNAVEGTAVKVPFDEVLLYLGAQCLQRKPHMPQDRVVPQHRVLALDEVIDAHGRNGRDHSSKNPPAPRSHDSQRQQCPRESRQQCDAAKPDQCSPPPEATECFTASVASARNTKSEVKQPSVLDSEAADEPDLVPIRVGKRRQPHALVGLNNLAGLKATPFQLIDVVIQILDSEVDDR